MKLFSIWRKKGSEKLPGPATGTVTVVSEPPPKQPAQTKGVAWHKIYEAADRSDFRGYFYLPTLSPAEQLNFLTRRALYERIDFLYKNVGAVTMVIDGLAMDEAGTGLWPKWISSNADYNVAMTDRFHYAAHDPRFFSSDGETDYYTCQFNIRRMSRLYGDSFGQLLRPAPGQIVPLMHLLPGYRCENLAGGSDSGFVDGVQRDALGRAIQYAFTSGEFEKGGQIVDAADVLHFHDPFLPGQTRGVSALASVCKKLFRREDILKALNNGTLARERIGFAIQTKAGTSSGDEPGLEVLSGGTQVDTVKNQDGTEYQVMRIFGEGKDEEIQVPKLSNNAELKMVESNRPAGPVTDFLDLMLREVAWATLYSPEYLFFKGGMGQGTVARMVLQQASGIIKARRSQQLIPQFCNRWNNYFAWQIIKSGTLPKNITIPDDWWKHKILGDADKSVDIGREGRLYDERVSTGKMSVELYHAMNGEDADDVDEALFKRMDSRLNALKLFNKKHGTDFDYYDIWARTANAQPPTEPPQEEAAGTAGKTSQ